MSLRREFRMLGLYIVILLFPGCQGSCTGDNSTVATMCHNSVVSGTELYIDTDLAGTLTLTNGVGCTCYVETRIGKKVDVYSKFEGTTGMECGTSVEVTSNSETAATQCYTASISVIVGSQGNITVDLRRKSPPYVATYCVRFTLKYCAANGYQCNDGSCISDSKVCDAIPDCPNGEDELNCAGSCSEGLLLCDDDRTCISRSMQCDGTTQCPDGSDEAAKYCDPNYSSSNESANDASIEPRMTITCLKSNYLPTTIRTTSTTTTTPTSSANTPKTMTTTTPAPNTTTTMTTTTPAPNTTTTMTTTTPSPNTTTRVTTTTPAPTTSTIAPITATKPPTTATTPALSTLTGKTASTTIIPTMSTKSSTLTTEIPTIKTAPPTESSTALTTATTKEPSISLTSITTTMTPPQPTITQSTPAPTLRTSNVTTSAPPITTQRSFPTTEADDDNAVVIVGIVTGLAGLFLLILCIVCWIKTRRWNKRSQHSMTHQS